ETFVAHNPVLHRKGFITSACQVPAVSKLDQDNIRVIENAPGPVIRDGRRCQGVIPGACQYFTCANYGIQAVAITTDEHNVQALQPRFAHKVRPKSRRAMCAPAQNDHLHKEHNRDANAAVPSKHASSSPMKMKSLRRPDRTR